jgi:hypothetical protein
VPLDVDGSVKEQAFAEHVAELEKVPLEQANVPDAVNPEEQLGVHVCPLLKVKNWSVMVPGLHAPFEFAGKVVVQAEFNTQIADDDSTPLRHENDPTAL